MDKLNFSLDQLVADSRKSNNKAKSLKSRKMETKKAKVVKSSSSKSASNAKAKPARELRQPTAQQVARNVTKVAADSVLSRLGPKLDECSIVISNLNYNISLGDVRELCATVGKSRLYIYCKSLCS
jgi:hypothetical protein